MTSQVNRRLRRIGADEAHSWARNLRLGNPYAKLVLSMLTIYVNGEGSCFVSVPQLAEDCELAVETVRRRLAWLETIGAIVRAPQWLDEHGRRNPDARGKRTTDDIRLMLHGDVDAIESAAGGNGENNSAPESDSVSPVHEGGTKSASPPAGSPVAPSLQTGANDSEPEPEDSPNPPSGGDLIQNPIQNLSDEAQAQLDRFKTVYPAPITNYGRVVAIWAVLTHQEREDAITGAIGYAAYLRDIERKGKHRNIQDAHRWLRDRAWLGYLATGQKAAERARQRMVTPGSPEGRAWAQIHHVAHLQPFASSIGYLLKRDLTPQELAFADAPPRPSWEFIDEAKTNQVGAWRSFLGKALAGKQLPELVRPIAMRRGFHAPWPWPPRKDGSIIIETSIVAGTLMTEQDVEDCAKI